MKKIFLLIFMFTALLAFAVDSDTVQSAGADSKFTEERVKVKERADKTVSATSNSGEKSDTASQGRLVENENIPDNEQSQTPQTSDKKREKTLNINADKIYINIKGADVSANDKQQKEAAPVIINPLETIKKEPAKKKISRIKKFFINQWEKVKDIKAFELGNLITAGIAFLLAIILARLSRWFFEIFLHRKLAKRTKTVIDDKILVALSPCLAVVIFMFVFYLGLFAVIHHLPGNVFEFISRACIAVVAGAVFAFFYRLVEVLDYFLNKLARRTDNNLDNLITSLIRKTLKIVIMVIAVLFIGKSILNFDITTLLASAGVAGLAIAFAAQDTIANFFGSIMITLDKPFRHGERISVDGVSGFVENVGFRSTMLCTLDGHKISVPNKKLAETIIENISKRPFIKFQPTIGVTYDTSPEKVEEAMTILRDVYNKIPPCDCEDGISYDALNPHNPHKTRVFFDSFGDFSLNIKVICWYHPADYFAAMEWHSKANVEILERFNAAGIEFAFPSNTTYLAGDPSRALHIQVEQTMNQ